MHKDFICRLAAVNQTVTLEVVRRDVLTLAELELLDKLMRPRSEYREALKRSIEAAMARLRQGKA